MGWEGENEQEKEALEAVGGFALPEKHPLELADNKQGQYTPEMSQARGILLRVLVNVQRNDKSGCTRRKQCSTLDCTTLKAVPQHVYNKMDKKIVDGWRSRIFMEVYQVKALLLNKREFEMVKGRVKVNYGVVIQTFIGRIGHHY